MGLICFWEMLGFLLDEWNLDNKTSWVLIHNFYLRIFCANEFNIIFFFK
jgi:hypothetical protein